MRIIALLIVLACFATAQTANADLVISINIADQALMFLENDTGTLDGEGSYSFETGFLGEEFEFLDLSASGLPETPQLVIDPAFGGIAIFGGFGTPDATVTFTGSGTPISYSSFSADAQAVLEGSIGSTLEPGNSGFSPIRIVNAVPEPASAAVLAGIGLVGLCIRRRRRV